MYTMVLMMAAGSAGESPDFFRNKSSGCTGTVVATAPAGCTGYAAAPAGCTGYVAASAGCTGTSRGGFLGIRARLFGGRGNGCTGSAPAYSSGCHGTVVAAPACGGCPPVATCGCHGTVVGSYSAPVGCAPSMGTVMTPGTVIGTPVVNPPVTMPEVKPADPKKADPKKDDTKKGSEL